MEDLQVRVQVRALVRALDQAQIQADVQVVHQAEVAAAPGTQGKQVDLDCWICLPNKPCSDTSPARPSYGGGRYYGGGSTTAYRAGGRSPAAGIAPYFLASALIFPGVWLFGVYAYNYDHPYNYHNRTNTTDNSNGSNETLPVTCLCEEYNACGCDDNNNSTYLDTILGDGTPASQNSSLVHVGDVNGTKTIVLNGTLPNGTDTTDAAEDDSTSDASKRFFLEMSGFWLVGAIVGATVWMI